MQVVYNFGITAIKINVNANEDPRKYTVRFSYETAEDTVIIDETEYESYNDITNLSLDADAEFLSMTGVKDSRTFNISA
jgi:hypothetical protein